MKESVICWTYEKNAIESTVMRLGKLYEVIEKIRSMQIEQ